MCMNYDYDLIYHEAPLSLSLSHPRVTVSMMHARAFIESIPANMKLFIYYYLESMSYELLITAKTAHRIIKNNYRLWMILSSICNNLHITRFYYFVVWRVYRRSVHSFFFSFTIRSFCDIFISIRLFIYVLIWMARSFIHLYSPHNDLHIYTQMQLLDRIVRAPLLNDIDNNKNKNWSLFQLIMCMCYPMHHHFIR